MDTKVTAAGAIAAGAGVVQTVILREKVDRKYPTKNIPSLKGFGYISSLVGLISGGTGLAIGAIGSSKDKTGRQRLADIYNEAAIDYGATALVGGILSGVFPAVTEADCVKAGGYYYDGACHPKPKAGTTSMEDAPVVQTAAYKAPIPRLESTDVYKNLTAELQRLNAQTQALAQENAALRAMNPAIEVRGGTVVRGPSAPSGFMAAEPVRLPAVAELYPVGHPETGTRTRGFMGEAMASGYGF